MGCYKIMKNLKTKIIIENFKNDNKNKYMIDLFENLNKEEEKLIIEICKNIRIKFLKKMSKIYKIEIKLKD